MTDQIKPPDTDKMRAAYEAMRWAEAEEQRAAPQQAEPVALAIADYTQDQLDAMSHHEIADQLRLYRKPLLSAAADSIDYLAAQEGSLEKAQQSAARAHAELAETKRPLDAQMARLNQRVIDLTAELDALREPTTLAQQAEPVAWAGNNPRTGVVELCSDKPTPSVMRDFKMRPLYAGPRPTPEAEQTCNCRWNGDVQIKQCTLHQAHVEAIHEWAERAKDAERQLAQQANPEVLLNDARYRAMRAEAVQTSQETADEYDAWADWAIAAQKKGGA